MAIATTASVAFMTVMIGIGNVTSNNSFMIPPPTVTKEIVMVEDMQTCRKLEAAFHNGYSTVRGETKVSSETYETGRDGLVAKVVRESSCIK